MVVNSVDEDEHNSSNDSQVSGNRRSYRRKQNATTVVEESDRKFETSEISGSSSVHFNSNNGTDVIYANDVQVKNATSRESLSGQEELGRLEANGSNPGKDQADIDPVLLMRPSWCDASFAITQIKEGNAKGKVYALTLRAQLHMLLFRWGCFIQSHPVPILLSGIFVLAACSIGLLNAHLESDLEKLWVETGGRLEEELHYSREALFNTTNSSAAVGSSYEVLIQTGFDTLTVESLLFHSKAAIAATKVTVVENNVTWKFSDLCVKQEFSTEGLDPFIGNIILQFIPCIIIGPLDCFWEGSKLLGPDTGKKKQVLSIETSWTNLDPSYLIQLVKYVTSSPEALAQLDYYQNLLVQAGVTSGYTKRWCLDPNDPECPSGAPNKANKTAPDVKAIVSAGCTGFATELMKWPLDLIVGGIYEDSKKTVKRAEGLQTILNLRSKQNVYEAYKGTKKVGKGWDQKRANQVLLAWQRKFVNMIYELSKNETARKNISSNITDQLYAFSGATTLEVLDQFSRIGIGRIVGGYVLMLVYSYLTLMRFNPSRSQGSVGVAGVLLVLLSVAAGLGISSAIGISFNAASTQVLPFLLLGLGVDDMFLMAHHFGEISVSKHVPYSERVGECLKRVGVSVALTSIAILSGFLFSLIIPMPALRFFGLQAAIVTLFNLATVLTIFPALLSLDLKRRERNKYDLLCCFTSSSRNHVAHRDDGNQSTVNVLATAPPPHQAEKDISTKSSQNHNGQRSLGSGFLLLTIGQMGERYYAPFLLKNPVRIFVVIAFAVLFGLSVYGCTQVRDGLDLGDVLPRGTREHDALVVQTEYFSFYNMLIATQDFDYPENQVILNNLHKKMGDLKYIIRNTDGTLGKFWLQFFRDWLIDIQSEFDKDWARGSINSTGWNKNASTKSVLAYKLLAQTGKKGKEAVDKTRIGCVLPATECTKPQRTRLVSDKGVINPNAFYNYLSAWVGNDPLTYTGSQSELRPEPKTWTHNRFGDDFTIPPSPPLVYTQMPFYLKDMRENEDFVYVINWIRGLLDETAENTPVRAYPSGYPFTFWQQYITLRFWLFISLGCVIAAVFLVLSLVLMNPWAAFIMAGFLAMIACELMGFMGAAGVKLSAVPAVILVAAIGLGVEFTVHITFAFITSCGTRKERVIFSIGHMIGPVVDGAISTFLGVIMLAWAEFDIIVEYFFQVLAILIFLGVLNGLILLPVVLSLIGPPPEVIPIDGGSSLKVFAHMSSITQKTEPLDDEITTLSNKTGVIANTNNSNNAEANNKEINKETTYEYEYDEYSESVYPQDIPKTDVDTGTVEESDVGAAEANPHSASTATM